MKTLRIECPDIILRSFHTTEEQFGHMLRLAAAVKFFELGHLSSGRAAELAGLSRLEFMHKLSEYNISLYGDIAEDVAKDLDAAEACVR